MPEYIKTAVFIGAGNVAWHLAKALQENNIKIIQVIGRSIDSTQSLAEELKTEFKLELNQVNRNADIYIVAVNDDVIVDISKNLKLSDRLIVHTSGSTPLSVFESYFENYGVLYPLQTFTKSRELNLKEVPVFIEANSENNLYKISALSHLISNRVVPADSATRAKLHLAAVFACNFTNHMYCIAEDILKSEKIDLSVLYPLMLETAVKALIMKPAEAQTGPAVRGNNKLIKKHLEMLENNPHLKNIYGIISESIQNKLTHAI